jgi:hypothetical protein
LRRGDFIMFLKVFQLNGSLPKKKPSKYTPTTNSYDLARRSGHKRYIIKLSIK